MADAELSLASKLATATAAKRDKTAKAYAAASNGASAAAEKLKKVKEDPEVTPRKT